MYVHILALDEVNEPTDQHENRYFARLSGKSILLTDALGNSMRVELFISIWSMYS